MLIDDSKENNGSNTSATVCGVGNMGWLPNNIHSRHPFYSKALYLRSFSIEKPWSDMGVHQRYDILPIRSNEKVAVCCLHARILLSQELDEKKSHRHENNLVGIVWMGKARTAFTQKAWKKNTIQLGETAVMSM